MGFANLKKTSPSVNRQEFTVDEFIDDALNYAQGAPQVVGLHRQLGLLDEPAFSAPDPRQDDDAPFQRATFTLSDKARQQLSQLSQSSGIPRSRLLRIWLDQESAAADIRKYLLSTVR